MAFHKQAKNIMNTHVVNSGLPKVPAGVVLVFDSETGMMQDAASVQDRAAYYRYLVLRASLASGSQEDRPEETPPRKPGQ